MVMRQESGLSCVAVTDGMCLRQQKFENEMGEFLVFPARWILVATLFIDAIARYWMQGGASECRLRRSNTHTELGECSVQLEFLQWCKAVQDN